MTPRHAVAALGTALGPAVLAECRALFDGEQRALAGAVPPLAVDCAYGPDPRQRLDIYGATTGPLKPVLLFVHGGGFVQGDKGGVADHWANAAVGRMAARAGLCGAVMNYRLAPAHGWPAGAQDVGAAVDWLHHHAPGFGGDPGSLFLVGTSAGAVHASGFLAARPDATERVRGAVLLSGLYGYTALDQRDEQYYGDAALYPVRMPRTAMAMTTLPLLVACAEFDPPRFQAEFLGLLGERLERHGAMPRSFIASGHNHYTMAMHLGTTDRRLQAEILDFIGGLA